MPVDKLRELSFNPPSRAYGLSRLSTMGVPVSIIRP